MRSVILAAATLLAAQTFAIAADSAAVSKGVRVMPKLGAVVKVGTETIDHAWFTLPWIVQDVKVTGFWSTRARAG